MNVAAPYLACRSSCPGQWTGLESGTGFSYQRLQPPSVCPPRGCEESPVGEPCCSGRRCSVLLVPRSLQRLILLGSGSAQRGCARSEWKSMGSFQSGRRVKPDEGGNVSQWGWSMNRIILYCTFDTHKKDDEPRITVSISDYWSCIDDLVLSFYFLLCQSDCIYVTKRTMKC